MAPGDLHPTSKKMETYILLANEISSQSNYMNLEEDPELQNTDNMTP